MEYIKYTRGWLLIIIALILTQCNPNSISQNSTNTTQITPSETGTATHRPTLTPTLTRTPRPTRTPSWTPVATLPPEQAQSLLAELVETNGGCDYPCWWGIVPGETTWANARELLLPIASKTYIGKKGSFYNLTFPIPNGDYSDTIFSHITVEDGIVDIIRTNNVYNIFEMLEVFGKPDQIWVHVIEVGVPIFHADTRIALFYPEAGLMGVYSEATAGFDKLMVCPKNSTYESSIKFLWSTESKKTFRDLEYPSLTGQYPSPHAFYVSLEEGTELDVDRFYDTYSDPSNRSTCFEAIDRTLITPVPTP